MRSVEFLFDIDETVTVTPIKKTGVVAMCALDDGGKKYFVQGEGDGQWWPERMLAGECASLRIKDLLALSVAELKLSVRAANNLRAARVRTLGDLVQRDPSELLQHRNFGRVTLKEIQDHLARVGLHFGMDISTHLGDEADPDRKAAQDELAEAARIEGEADERALRDMERDGTPLRMP